MKFTGDSHKAPSNFPTKLERRDCPERRPDHRVFRLGGAGRRCFYPTPSGLRASTAVRLDRGMSMDG